MKYDVMGATGLEYCAAVYDATGQIIPLTTSCDTETGDVVRYEYPWRVDPVSSVVVSIVEKRPAPLRLIQWSPRTRWDASVAMREAESIGADKPFIVGG